VENLWKSHLFLWKSRLFLWKKIALLWKTFIGIFTLWKSTPIFPQLFPQGSGGCNPDEIKIFLSFPHFHSPYYYY